MDCIDGEPPADSAARQDVMHRAVIRAAPHAFGQPVRLQPRGGARSSLPMIARVTSPMSLCGRNCRAIPAGQQRRRADR